MNEDDQILISSYLDGELSQEEEAKVLKLFEESKEARDFYLEMQSSKLELNQYFLSKEINKVNKNLFDKAISISKKKNYFKKILIAASAVAAAPLLIFTPIGFFADNQYNEEKNLIDQLRYEENIHDNQIFSDQNAVRAVRDEKNCENIEILEDKLNLDLEECSPKDLEQ